MNKIIKYSTAFLGSLSGILVTSAAIYLPFVLKDAGRKYCDNCDYLLILGGNVIGADTPSPQLKERMITAAEYLNNHPYTVAIPCGGCFRKEQKKSEAKIIADYLTAQGIDPGRIMLEDKSTTTFENFENAAELIEDRGDSNPKIAFLSSSYHIHRASVIAVMCGYKSIGRVTAKDSGVNIKRLIREYFVAYELLIKKIKK